VSSVQLVQLLPRYGVMALTASPERGSACRDRVCSIAPLRLSFALAKESVFLIRTLIIFAGRIRRLSLAVIRTHSSSPHSAYQRSTPAPQPVMSGHSVCISSPCTRNVWRWRSHLSCALVAAPERRRASAISQACIPGLLPCGPTSRARLPAL
jgi:hypothetical protein